MYANEEMFRKGTSEELKKVKIWKIKILNNLIRTIKNNKFLMATISAFILFSIVNAMMICTFFRILQKV